MAVETAKAAVKTSNIYGEVMSLLGVLLTPYAFINDSYGVNP